MQGKIVPFEHMKNLTLEDPALVSQIKALTIKLETQNERLNAQSMMIENQKLKLNLLEIGMCRCVKNEGRHEQPNPNSSIYSSSNLTNREDESELSDDTEESEQVQVKPSDKGKNPTYYCDSVPPHVKDRQVPDVEKFDGISTQLRGFLDQLDTYFRMKPATYQNADFERKILYVSLRYTAAAINWGRKTLPPRGAPWELPLEC